MFFNEIKNALRAITWYELRFDDDQGFEAVVDSANLDAVNACCAKFFGPPIFPSSVELSSAIKKDIQPHGGIMPGQTLYYSSQGNEVFFAMLWPWGGGNHTTVKIIKKTS